jgi:hypothetical protein
MKKSKMVLDQSGTTQDIYALFQTTKNMTCMDMLRVRTLLLGCAFRAQWSMVSEAMLRALAPSGLI